MDARELLGSQIWLEQHDTPKRVDGLFKKAAQTGLGWARLFLMWPWLQPTPDLPEDEWNWELWDHAFDAAGRHGIKIKATLTANSGPWHWGTPSMLHSHTGFIERSMWGKSEAYTRACVTRYHRHPALGQWVLWNEPFDEGWDTPEFSAFWRTWLGDRYGHRLDLLNQKWGTGYASFEEIPRAERVPHAAHTAAAWNSSFPHLDEINCRQDWLIHQLRAVRDWVRAIDPITSTCVNPTHIHANRPHGGTDLEAMCNLVDVLGASFHPSWHFTFANRADFPGLIYAGVSALREIPGGHAIETTEVQTGNTADSGLIPNDAGPDAVAKYHLAALAAGSKSVTGWCFNARQHDNEAGDWALLDDADEPGPRAVALRHLHDRLDAILQSHGPMRPVRPRVWVATDSTTQTYEAIHGRQPLVNTPGRHHEDSARGAAMLVVECLRQGVPASTVPLIHLAERLRPGDVAILSHLTAYDPELAESILERVRSGVTLVIDATTGRRDQHLSMPRPWPGGFSASIGLRMQGLESRAEGWALASGGHAILCRSRPDTTDPNAWSALASPRFADGEPLALKRRFGEGRVVHVRSPIGPSLLHDESPAWHELLASLTESIDLTVRPAVPTDAVFLPIHLGDRAAVVIVGGEGQQSVRLKSATALGRDLWSDATLERPAWAEQIVALNQGCAIVT
ncbi:MAG: beta-galactosidase [Planctomycetota bacterium]